MDDADFSTLFHQSSKSHAKGHPPVPADTREWTDEWKTTYYKTYPRLPKIPLAEKLLSSTNLSELIAHRKSRRNFSRIPLTFHELSSLLRHSAGSFGVTEGKRQRAQPSGGAYFPVELYPMIFHGNAEVPAGIYHYDVRKNALDVLWQRTFSDKEIDSLFLPKYSWVKNSALVLFMTAVFSRTKSRYGERGYRYILLEAGHIGQNIYLVSETLGLKCCAMGGTLDESIEELLDIDGATESLIYAVAVGR